MTTATGSTSILHPRQTAARVLGGSVLAAAAWGVLAGLAGLVFAGGAAFGSALVGGVLVAVVLALGAMTVDVVAGMRPQASLIVALLTYVLQMGAVLLLVVAVAGSAELGDVVERGWFAAGVIGAAAAWTAAQIRLALTSRIPLYDLPAGRPEERAEADER